MRCLFLISGTSIAVDVDVDVVAIIIVVVAMSLIIIEAFDRVVLQRHLHKLSNNVKPCT